MWRRGVGHPPKSSRTMASNSDNDITFKVETGIDGLPSWEETVVMIFAARLFVLVRDGRRRAQPLNPSTSALGAVPVLAPIMKIFSISVVLAPRSGASVVLSNANDLSSFSFYQRGSVGEFLSFFTRTVAERTAQSQRQSIQENSYTAHVFNRGGAEQLAGISSFDSFIRGTTLTQRSRGDNH